MSDPPQVPTPVIGMVHLPALPGAPDYGGDRAAIREHALRDARRLDAGGVDAVLVENFGDAPLYPDEVPAHVATELTAVVGRVVDEVSVPVGVNVLRNDGAAALSVAAAAGADFVRVNVLVGAAATDQGVIEGRAHELLRLRERIGADVAICGDVDVKHATPIGDRPLAARATDAVERGGADAVVVSGPATGAETPLADLRTVREAVGETLLLVGSGAAADTLPDLLSVADGAIVGTALKEGGETTAPVDRERVERVVSAAEQG